MSLPQIPPASRKADQVFEAMHTAIMSGELPAGHHLRIRDIAAQLGTSVMPVREAIRRLEENGLAESLPHRGAVVKSLTPEELLDIYTVRRLLEIEATRQGAEHSTAEDLAAMESELKAIEQALGADQSVAYLNHDENLLSVVYAASGNPVLLNTIQTLWQRCRPYKIVGVKGDQRSMGQHELVMFQQRLVEAVRAGDPEEAVAATAGSLDAAIQRIRDALDDRQ